MTIESSVIGGKQNIPENYQGKVLIATPMMNDDYFEKAVVFLCSHDESHSFGVMINKPCGSLTAEQGTKKKKFRLLTGGPVDNDTIFVLTHSDDQEENFGAEKELTLFMNAQEFMNDVMNGTQTEKFVLCKGFSAWDAGQLESEIAEGAWLLADIDFEEIFSTKKEKLWEKLIKKCGIKNPTMVVPYSGRA